MFRTLSFQNTGDLSPNDRNWRILNEGSKSISFLPTVTGGINTVTPTTGVAQLYGPIVLVLFTFSVPDLAGFSTTTTINIPFEAYNNNGTLTIPTVLDVVIPTTGAVLDTCYFSDSSTLKFAGGYTNNSGSTKIVNIQGWYFRN